MNNNTLPLHRRMSLPWLLLALVVAGVVGGTWYSHSRPPIKDPVSAFDATVGASGELQRQHPTPDEIRELAARRSTQAGPATVMDMAGMIEKRKRMGEATQERIRMRNAEMASSFATEKTDTAWASAHERSLASLQDSGPIRDAGAEAQNFQAECRSSMCRIQADFPNRSAAEDWLQLYTAGLGNNLPVVTAHKTANPDGSVRLEIYGIGRKR